MRVFRWLNEDSLPAAWDLRACGWHFLSTRKHQDECVAIADASRMDSSAWSRFLTLYQHENRRLIILLGVDDASERAGLLRCGFGEVLDGLELRELEARALRLAELEVMIPRFRQVGRLRLDLLAREAFVHGSAVGLHPREFGLLWRLADNPGMPIGKRTLIRDIWQLRFIPETNSLAVHISRLRAKLRAFGIAEMLETTRNGEYVLREPPLPFAEGTEAMVRSA